MLKNLRFFGFFADLLENGNFGNVFQGKSTMKNFKTRGVGLWSKVVWTFSNKTSTLETRDVPLEGALMGEEVMRTKG